MDDKTLLRLLRSDPDRGMEELMKCYTGLVYAVVRSRLNGSLCVSSDIEDCVSDVFCKFYTELSRFDPEASSIRSYLCVMARNHAINVSKKRSLQGGVSLDDGEVLFELSDGATVDGSLEREELRRELIKAVIDLGEPDSSIIFRKFYYGEPSKEIAKALGLSVSNVDTRTHRALNRLRKTFGGEEK